MNKLFNARVLISKVLRIIAYTTLKCSSLVASSRHSFWAATSWGKVASARFNNLCAPAAAVQKVVVLTLCLQD
jgi:hypothetical protein